LELESVDFVQKFKDALARIRGNLLETNTKGCFNNSIDLTRTSDFVGFNDGVFVGEVLESIFRNFNDMVQVVEYNKAEIEPVKAEIEKLLTTLEVKFPPKNDRAKAEIYDALVSARSCTTHVQISFFREKKLKPSAEPELDE
jgi:hypothetical protein